MLRISQLVVALLTLLLIAVMPTAAPAEADGGQTPGLVGTWMLLFPQEAPSLITFHADGTLVGTQAPVRPPIGVEPPYVTAVFQSAFQGVWEQAGDQQYRMTFLLLEYDQNGELLLVIDVHSRITLAADGNSFTTVDTFQVRSADGAVIFTLQDDPGARGIRVRLGVNIPFPTPRSP